MRFLIRLVPKSPAHEEFLSTVRALARSVGSEARNPKWTSYGALEVDVFSPSQSDFNLLLPLLEPLSALEFSKDLNMVPEYKPEEELLNEARGYFNAERYWECHEVLEGLWRTKQGAEKLYLQGLILVCAAFVHHQKGEEKVALGVLARAERQLAYEGPAYHGIDVQAVQAEVRSTLASGRFRVFSI